MAGTQKVQVVGTSIHEGVATVQFDVPAEQLANFQKNLPAGFAKDRFGSTTARDMGSRYGLAPDSQTLTTPAQREDRIKLARDIYENEPLVATAIDMMVDLCLTGMKNRSEDEKAKEYFDLLCKYADFDNLHRQIFLELFLSSDVFIMRGNKQKVKYGVDTGFEYFDYTVLNPLYVEVTGTLLNNSFSYGIKPNEDLKKLAKQTSKEAKKLMSQLPAGLRDAAIKNTLWIPPEGTITRISRKRAAYDRYSTPFLTRIFEPALIKRRMRDADVALAETVRSVLVTITIGSDEFPADDAQIRALSNLFETPAKSMELFWNHTLNVEYHFPDAALFDDTKYNQVNKDMVQGLGVPPVLIDGGGGTFATAWTSLLSIMERLDALRDQVRRWQESEYASIAEATKQNFKVIPTVKFNPLNLRDDKVFKNTLLELFDRGQLSSDTLLSATDLDLDVEVRNRIAEEKAGINEALAPRKAIKDEGGRPNDKVDPGNYEERDQTPSVDDQGAENDSSNGR